MLKTKKKLRQKKFQGRFPASIKKAEFVRIILIVEDEECDARIKNQLLKFAEEVEKVSVRLAKKKEKEE